jgi:hypothetical protein
MIALSSNKKASNLYKNASKHIRNSSLNRSMHICCGS